MGNTEKVGAIIAHGIDDTLFVVKIPGNITATVDCPEGRSKVIINQEAMITLPLDCSLNTDLFMIPESHIEKTQTDKVVFKIDNDHPKLSLFDKEKTFDAGKRNSVNVMLEKNADDIDSLDNSTLDAHKKADSMIPYVHFVYPAVGGSLTFILLGII